MREELLLEEKKRGWGFTGRGKFHYYDGSGQSICRKYNWNFIPVLIDGVWQEDCCQKCWKLKKGER